MASFNKNVQKPICYLKHVEWMNFNHQCFCNLKKLQLIVFILQKESLLSCFKVGGHNSNSFSAIAETSSLSWMVACFPAAFSLGDKWALYGPNLHSCLEENVATKNGILWIHHLSFLRQQFTDSIMGVVSPWFVSQAAKMLHTLIIARWPLEKFN